MFARLFSCIFQSILDGIFPPRAHEVLVRNASYKEIRNISNPNAVRIEHVPIVTLLPYRLPLLQALITEAKFEHSKHAQELLGELLADYIKVSLLPTLSRGEALVLVPMPLGKARQKERGYNQVEEVAKHALRKLLDAGGMSTVRMVLAPNLLVRTRETAPQTSLGRAERLVNMQDAFMVNPSALPDDFIYLLIDDVVTTGATLLAAHTALATLGSNRIFVLALAH